MIFTARRGYSCAAASGGDADDRAVAERTARTTTKLRSAYRRNVINVSSLRSRCAIRRRKRLRPFCPHRGLADHIFRMKTDGLVKPLLATLGGLAAWMGASPIFAEFTGGPIQRPTPWPNPGYTPSVLSDGSLPEQRPADRLGCRRFLAAFYVREARRHHAGIIACRENEGDAAGGESVSHRIGHFAAQIDIKDGAVQFCAL